MVADRHKVAGEKFIVRATNIDQALPDDLVAVRISSVGNQREKLAALGMFVYRAEMIVSEHDRKCT